ncbi:hypothetical protein ABBQ38_001636 [Trebouxia sp. C0009 RCD-2024]
MQASPAPLQVLCAAQAGAQAISEAAGQVGLAGISPVFGKDPCKLFQGPQGNSYCFNRTSESAWEEFGDAQTSCAQAGYYWVDEAVPRKDDCLHAINRLGSTNGSTICIAQQPNS